MPNRKQPMYVWRYAFCLAALALTASLVPAQAGTDDFMMDTTKGGHHDPSVVSSDQMLDLGTSTSSALRLEGEQSMRFNNIERAIMVLQKAVEISPGDMDGHILYAEALEKKLNKQKDRDPSLYNFVVKQWLYVSKKAAFLDQAMQGSSHLLKLTGQKPHKFEREGHYLSRVLLPETANNKVAAKAEPKTQ
jgi:hypothetical protein